MAPPFPVEEKKMESAFGVDHGEISKKVKNPLEAAGLMRPKKITDHGGMGETVDRKGTWALKAKRNTTKFEGSKVTNTSSGGGLTGRGALAAGGAGGGVAGYVGNKKRKSY